MILRDDDEETPKSGKYKYITVPDIQKRWALTIAEIHLIADEHSWSRRRDERSQWHWQYRKDQVERDLGQSVATNA